MKSKLLVHALVCMAIFATLHPGKVKSAEMAEKNQSTAVVELIWRAYIKSMPPENRVAFDPSQFPNARIEIMTDGILIASKDTGKEIKIPLSHDQQEKMAETSASPIEGNTTDSNRGGWQSVVVTGICMLPVLLSTCLLLWPRNIKKR